MPRRDACSSKLSSGILLTKPRKNYAPQRARRLPLDARLSARARRLGQCLPNQGKEFSADGDASGRPAQTAARAATEREGEVRDGPRHQLVPPARFAGPSIAQDCRGFREGGDGRSRLRGGDAEGPPQAVVAEIGALVQDQESPGATNEIHDGGCHQQGMCRVGLAFGLRADYKDDTRRRDAMGLLSDRELAGLLPAETHAFAGPIPTQSVSSDEFVPAPQTRAQRRVEARVKALGDALARRHGMTRRRFLTTASGMAAAFLAMNEVYGPLYDVSTAEAQTPEMAKERAAGLAKQFVMDCHTHFLRDDTRIMAFVRQRQAVARRAETRHWPTRSKPSRTSSSRTTTKKCSSTAIPRSRSSPARHRRSRKTGSSPTR